MENYPPDYGTCPVCFKRREAQSWCTNCDVRRLEENFKHWTSGNSAIDNFIKYTQKNARRGMDYLEWIDFNQLSHVCNTGKAGAFTSNYSAIWIEGPKGSLDKNETWTNSGPTRVILKQFHNYVEANNLFFNQLYRYHRCFQEGTLADFFGFTRDVRTSRIMMVMRYYDHEDLYTFLDNFNGALCWRDIIEILLSVSEGLFKIHEFGLIHGNIHGGNILVEQDPNTIDARIADTGLSGDSFQERVFGVVPFIAPEVFTGSRKSQASDIYSFGMVMMMMPTGSRPYQDRSHDMQLIQNIKLGLRPQYPIGAPLVYLQLMEKCLSQNPSIRPTAQDVYQTIYTWIEATCINPEVTPLFEQFERAEQSLHLSGIAKPIHQHAVYISRDLNSI
ncbi:kinase-like protein [Rhizophagus irregularis]|uniref:Kinase-like protein n=1 Tax=Rhizophagus irregularis TaxID=588596 RepID=A0A2I1GLF4_9GLOM|nr:kinase-like protein [Rhizophagus irregularis]